MVTAPRVAWALNCRMGSGRPARDGLECKHGINGGGVSLEGDLVGIGDGVLAYRSEIQTAAGGSAGGGVAT